MGGLGFRVSGLGLRVEGFGFRVSGSPMAPKAHKAVRSDAEPAPKEAAPRAQPPHKGILSLKPQNPKP